MNAIFTTRRNVDPGISAITRPSLEAYASRTGSEIVDGESKFELFSLLNKFRRIAVIDADVLVRDDCPNLFDVVPEAKVGLFNEGAFVDRLPKMREIVKAERQEIPKWNRQYYNTGVMVVSRRHKQLLRATDKEFDQIVNLRLASNDFKVHELDYKMNRMGCVDRLTGESRLASYMIHYEGIEAMPPGERAALVAGDASSWEANRPGYSYKRNIFVSVGGGLGDEVCAEPVVRYLAEKAYPGANIVVETWFKRLFKHLPVRTFEMGEFKPEKDTTYYKMETLVPPDNPAWKYMSVSLMHATDFASILCLRQTLPDASRQIKLVVDDSDVEEARAAIGCDFNDVVLVHAGKGWPSKTFPSSWWEDVCKGLLSKGVKVVLIGKEISDEQGTQDLHVPGVIDVRNLLGLGAMIAVISQARVLVSNDSSPVHIAGAFDNHIVMIPTCKHPDHVLPLRNGSRRHKAVALCKKLLSDDLESNPTQIHGQTIDLVKGDIMDYLPDASDVVASAMRAFME